MTEKRDKGDGGEVVLSERYIMTLIFNTRDQLEIRDVFCTMSLLRSSREAAEQ